MNELLPGIEPSDNDLIEMALALPLDRKIEKAIALLQEYEAEALKLGDYGYHVCDSFGKDSDCIVELSKMAGVKFELHHNLTTIDPPELIWYGRKERPETIIDRCGRGHLILDRMVEKATPPTRRARWCCAEYKEHGGDGMGKIFGVRIAESARRAGIWRIVNRGRNNEVIVAPIAYWTNKDVWNFHRLRKIPHCCLYDEGFKRFGCIGCPLAGPAGQKREFERWPRYEALWRLGFQRLWDRWHGIPNRKGEPRFFEKYGSVNAFYEWWRSGGALKGDDPQCVFEEMMEQAGSLRYGPADRLI